VASSSSPTFGFSNWGTATGSAAVCANNYICEFTITADSKAPAVFKKVFVFRVSVGNGEGSIKVTKNQTEFVVNCENKAPLSCNLGVLEGTVMKIEAIAKTGSQFQNFSAQTGNATACTGQGGANFTCNMKITQETSVVANFIPIP
jgi:Divergent InlB B-repeat domain